MSVRLASMAITLALPAALAVGCAAREAASETAQDGASSSPRVRTAGRSKILRRPARPQRAPLLRKESSSTSANEVGNARRRAWPVRSPGKGLGFVASSPSSGDTSLLVGQAALHATADRCPDHLECERIANNAADTAHYGCGAQCEACCPHASVDDCIRRACRDAIERCRGDGCSGDFKETWMRACTDRCRVEMSTCAGCRNVWCGEGPAVLACHSDADATHRESLRACDRHCPATELRADGACTVKCGAAKTTCSQRATDCRDGKSPDCRCECTTAFAGVCVAWKNVCTCD